MLDVVTGSCPISKLLVIESSAIEMEQMELQEDLGLKMIYKSQSTIKSWKQVPQIKYPELNKTQFSAQHTVVNHYIQLWSLWS